MNSILRLSVRLAALALALVTVSAWANPPTSYYIYDESGHVIGEYDANGNAVQEHVYLGDRPVAVVQGGSSGTVDYSTARDGSESSCPMGVEQRSIRQRQSHRFPYL